MPLSYMAIRHARPTDKNYAIGDFDGLSLMVTAAGKKRWLFRFYWEGQQTKMSFGSYPAVSLKQARKCHDDAMVESFSLPLKRERIRFRTALRCE